ncbi:metallophosphoesterase [uncultured Kordia sp.]|uniref:metallophosphoesterase n=1 Tax=uncultured Kordia sp. TaxID=507699 RepID=UPI002638F558|nr:metallophosphoesterase [uncultured Kordia sp.]
MKTIFLYALLLSLLFFGCKGKSDTKNDPTSDTNVEAKAGAAVEIAKTSTTATFLSLSDVHVDVDLKETTFGSSSISVTSDVLWNKTKTKIESVVKTEEPQFMVYLGDLPGYDDNERRENTHSMLENLRSLQVGIPILYLPGNNDSLEGDYHSFTNANGNSVLTKDADPSNPWPILNGSSTVTRPTNLDFNKEFGYYSVDLVNNGKTLKVIALNTVIFSNSGSHPYVGDDGVSQQKATQDQMHWFETTMKNLAANDRVMIMMHIPIGIDGYGGSPMWKPSLTYTDLSGTSHTLNNGFIDILEKHQKNITGLLNGHTHTDGLRRIYKSHTSDKVADMISYSISTPGIAVNHGNNPAFKVFTYNTVNFDLLDFKTYYAAPTNSAKNGDFQYNSNQTYTFKNVYKALTVGETIFTTLSNDSQTEVVQYVNETLGTKSNQGVKLNFDNAVDVHKN